MSDAEILKTLRNQVLDESESLPGLLRKCLALGAETGSDELREWANNELKGYPDGVALPAYRQLSAPLFVDTMGGPMYARGQQISHFQIPSDLRQYVPETIDFRQPIEEVAQMATSGDASHKMGYSIFSVVAAKWSETLPMFQDVTALYYQVSPSAIAGIISTIRTTLVEIVIDLAKDVPLDSLPSRARVDSVVQVHVGSQDNNYSVNVAGSNSGVIGQGDDSTQIQNHTAPSDLVPIIAQLRAALADVGDPDQKADAEQAINDFEDATSEGNPDQGKVKRRWGMLERIFTGIGSAAATQAVKDAAPVVLEHLQLLA